MGGCHDGLCRRHWFSRVGRVGAVSRGHLVLGGAGLTRVARKGASAEGLMVLQAQFQDVHVAPQASPTSELSAPKCFY